MRMSVGQTTESAYMDKTGKIMQRRIEDASSPDELPERFST
ncbi:hypothetical protein [Paenibacillus sp. P3E]|nr:hypothetical protein [Paenibacillus sp. P3E]